MLKALREEWLFLIHTNEGCTHSSLGEHTGPCLCQLHAVPLIAPLPQDPRHEVRPQGMGFVMQMVVVHHRWVGIHKVETQLVGFLQSKPSPDVVEHVFVFLIIESIVGLHIVESVDVLEKRKAGPVHLVGIGLKMETTGEWSVVTKMVCAGSTAFVHHT